MLFRSDRKSTRLNSSHTLNSYAVFCLKKKKASTMILSNEMTILVIDRTAVRLPRQYSLLCSSLDTILALPHALTARSVVFFFNDTATTEIYTLSLHDALPI